MINRFSTCSVELCGSTFLTGLRSINSQRDMGPSMPTTSPTRTWFEGTWNASCGDLAN